MVHQVHIFAAYVVTIMPIFRVLEEELHLGECLVWHTFVCSVYDFKTNMM